MTNHPNGIATLDGLTTDHKRNVLAQQRVSLLAERYSIEIQHRIQVRLKHTERAMELEKSLVDIEMALDEVTLMEKELD